MAKKLLRKSTARKAEKAASKKIGQRRAASGRRTSSSEQRTAKTGKRKYVYFFGNGKADGDRTMKDLLGGKGSGLAEMTNAGLPVPPGLTISTEACTLYYNEGRKTPAAVDKEMLANLEKLEKAAGARLGDVAN